MTDLYFRFLLLANCIAFIYMIIEINRLKNLNQRLRKKLQSEKRYI